MEPAKVLLTLDTNDATQDFYDNAPYHVLGESELKVTGAVAREYLVSTARHPKHEVLVKETRLTEEGQTRFVGAYKYVGVPLVQLLDSVSIVRKKDAPYHSPIDLIVQVSNAEGKKINFSWGELFYPTNRKQIIIATHVVPVLPSKVDTLWPIPVQPRLIAGHDLVSERTLEAPKDVRIFPAPFTEKRQQADSLYASNVSLKMDDQLLDIMESMPENSCPMQYLSVFYGRGRGIHGISKFEGILLKDWVLEHLPLSVERLQQGMFIVSAPDDYRGVFSYSEVVNRQDQAEVLLMQSGQQADGRFRLFPAADFFSDRAIKSVESIVYESF
jgi:hypothetical protein